MIKPNKKAKLPIFGKNGELLLEKILAKKEAYLESYQPESSYLHVAIKSLHKFETIYMQYEFEKLHGKIFYAYKERMFNEGAGTFTMEAKASDDRAFTILLLTLKSLEYSMSEYINAGNTAEDVSEAMSKLVMQTFVLGMLRGAEHVDDILKNKLEKLGKFKKLKKTDRDAYIINLKEKNPSLRNKQLIDIADKSIIGDISLGRFSNIK